MGAPAQQGFWMGNTQMSLDLIFANSDSTIVSISKFNRPHTQETIASGFPALFTVELEAGMSDAFGVVEGDKIRFVDTR